MKVTQYVLRSRTEIVFSSNNHKWTCLFICSREVSELIPTLVANTLLPNQWVNMVQEHFKLIRNFTVIDARTRYLGKLMALLK